MYKKDAVIPMDVSVEVNRKFISDEKKLNNYFELQLRKFKERIIYNNVMQLNRYRKKNNEFDRYLISHSLIDEDYESHKKIKKKRYRYIQR